MYFSTIVEASERKGFSKSLQSIKNKIKK